MNTAKPVVVVTTRIPADLTEWLDGRAKENMRSRHAEMMFILESERRREVSHEPPK